MKKNISARLLAMLLVIVMLVGVLPTIVGADSGLGRVKVIVENTTFSATEANEAGRTAPWDGVLVEEWIDLEASSTIMTCIGAALEKNNYTAEGLASGYISSINGLSQMAAGLMTESEWGSFDASGWMGTLNDWFTNEGFSAFTVANGALSDGDEIRIMYSCVGMGEDLGGSYDNNNKSLKALNFSVGTLTKTADGSESFHPECYEYNLTVPYGTTGVVVTPTAANKNFQVRTSVGTTEYKRTATVPAEDGTVITVKCGDPSWPTMNEASDVPATQYVVHIVEETATTISSIEFSTSNGSNFDSNKLALSPTFNSGTGTYSLLVPDSFSGYYLYAKFDGITDSSAKVKIKYLHYNGTSGEQTVDMSAGTPAYLGNLLKGSRYPDYAPTLEVTIDGRVAYTFNVVRIPSLSSFTLTDKDGPVALSPSFSANTNSYTALVSNGDVTVTAQGTGTSITVNGSTNTTVTPVWDSNYTSVLTVVSSNTAGQNTYTVTLQQKPVELVITQAPDKTSYEVGEAFDPTGMKVVATFADQGTLEIPLEECVITPSALTTEKEATITWRGVSTTQAITLPTLKGSGTEEDPYLIETYEDLQFLSNVVSAGGTYAGQYIKVMNDITLPSDWTGIGPNSYTNAASGKNIRPFSGIFDGNGKTFTFEKGSEALFNALREATLKNFSIQGEYIKGNGLIGLYLVDYGPTGSYGSTTGEIALVQNVHIIGNTKIEGSGFVNGYASGINTVTIENCSVGSGVILGCDEDGDSLNHDCVGSFAGEFNGYIKNSTSAALVYGKDHVGGLIGGKNQTMGPCDILDSTFTGRVAATGNFVGGIIGSGYVGAQWGINTAPNTPGVVIKNCTVTGIVKGVDYVGGIFGGEEGMVQCWENGIGYIQNNRFLGTIRATGTNVGGVIGYMNSLNIYNVIENNTYLEGCGATKGIGGAKYIDTNAVETSNRRPVVIDGITYVNTGLGTTPSINGFTFTDHNRDDLPMTDDADKLAKAITLQDLADEVAEKIAAIGTVTLESEEAIEAAREAYDALLDNAKPLVTNYETLTAAETAYAKLVADEADKAAAKAVSDKIDAIGTVTLESEEAIKAARAAYDALTDAQKALVTNLETLTAAESKLAELEEQATIDAANKAAADAVIEKINAIGTVTLDSKEAIEAARKAYDALTDAQKALVTNLKTLTDAETAYAELVDDTGNSDDTESPETGDSTPIVLLGILMAASLAGIAVNLCRKKYLF